jgi:hypothetical protein
MLSGRLRRKAGEPIDSLEIALINYLAFLKQFGIERRTDPKYLTPPRFASRAIAALATQENFRSGDRRRTGETEARSPG